MLERIAVGGNWKERPFEDGKQARDKAREFKSKFEKVSGATVVLFVSGKWLPEISKELSDSNIDTGVQSHFFDPDLPLGPQIDLAVNDGAKYAMVGHSMHRNPDPQKLPGVAPLTNEKANKVVRAIIEDGRLNLWYIVGVNEDSTRDIDDQKEVYRNQIEDAIKIGLNGLEKKPDILRKIIVTVEPTADISTKAGDGKIDPTTKVNFEKVDVLTNLLVESLRKKFGNIAEEINTGYGATAGPDTAELLMEQPHVFNILPGGKSLEADDFYWTVVNALKGKQH